MRKFIGKVLCRMGLHSWETLSEQRIAGLLVYYSQYCRRCGARRTM